MFLVNFYFVYSSMGYSNFLNLGMEVNVLLILLMGASVQLTIATSGNVFSKIPLKILNLMF